MVEVTEQRLDLCLYHLRFVKTRTLAQELIEKGRVRVNGEKVGKSSRKIKVGDLLVFPQGHHIRSICLLNLASKRLGAKDAIACYEDRDNLGLEQDPASE